MVLTTNVLVSAVIGLSLVSCRSYSPCGLARNIYKILENSRKSNGTYGTVNITDSYSDIPLLVCIAGYHDYNTHFRIRTRDGKLHVGIFGLVDSDAPKGPTVDQHLTNFVGNVLHLRGTQWRNENIYNFYRSLCNVPYLAKEVRCHLDNYVFGNYKVIVPLDRERLYNYFQSKDSYWVPIEER